MEEAPPAAQLQTQLEASFQADSPWRGQVTWLASTTSTNAEVLAQLAQGQTPPFVLLAEYQSQGRGQRERTWQAKPSQSLLLSAALEGPADNAHKQHAALAAGLALIQLCRTLGLNPRLKRPNDLYLEGKKCAGILIESQSDSPALCVGIGLNVSQAQTDFPPNLRHPATSLAQHLPSVPSRPQLAAMLLEGLADSFQQLRDWPESIETLAKDWMMK